MILDTADMELLRLAGWLKNLPVAAGTGFKSRQFSKARLEILQEYGLLSVMPGSLGLCRLKPNGYRLLESAGYLYPQDSKYVSDIKILTRRKQAAEIALTGYRAWNNVFADTILSLQQPQTYLSAAAIRRNKVLPNNTFGGARFCGIARDYMNAYLCYYVDRADTQMFFSNEMRMFQNAIAKTQCSSVIAYFGKSYDSIADIILSKPQEKERRKNDAVTFYEAYRRTTLPVYLIACSDIGAAQLLILGQENYRMKIAQAALGEQFAVPYQSLKGSDASFHNMPVVIGIDMDIRRIRAVYRNAKSRVSEDGTGFHNIAVIALKEQLSAIAKLCGSMKPEIFGIETEQALKALNLKLYEPEPQAYMTERGEFVYAEDFKANRKA